MNMELRVAVSKLDANADGTMTVSGYVNKTGQLSNVLGVAKRFVEKIAKGAFTRSIDKAERDIDFLAEHNGKLILASTRNGSLELREDEQGLFMSATISPTSWGKDYYQLINDGILQHMSFGFRTLKDSWKPIESGLFERTIDELELFEVSVVRDPAYSQSTIAARGIDLIEDVEVPAELEEEIREMENKFDEILAKLTSFEERFDSLANEIKELRSQEEQKEEIREQEEAKNEASEEQIEQEEEVQEVKNEESETEKEPENDENEGGNDMEETKNSEESEEKTEETEEEEEEQERSIDPLAEIAELRSRLSTLK